MSVALTRCWSATPEWHAHRHGRYVGSIVWLSQPMVFRVLSHDRRPVRDFADMTDAAAYLENPPC